VTAIWLIAACHAASHSEPAPVPVPAPPTDAPARAAARTDLVFRGVCDASAAIYADDGKVWIADDEANALRSFAPAGGDALKVADLGVKGSEADIEGGARIGDRFWWIGSHGRNKDGKPRPDRQLLLATDATGAVTARISTLLPALLAEPTLAPVLDPAEPHAPKQGGISIEGLAAGPQAGLWIGFRSPLSPAGLAPVVHLVNPDAVATGAAPVLSDVAWLDLGHRGIRSLEWDPARHTWWISAGAAGVVDTDFALYKWDGSAVVAVPADLGDLHVEALAIAPDGSLNAWSDDGTRPVGGAECKEAPVSQRSFRGKRLDL
jgi:hypothetical protein